MLFGNHTMTLITDPGMMSNEINNIDFVTVAAVTTTDAFLQHPNVYNASILMPPTAILMRWADGDPFVMQNEYPKYLNCNKDADDMIIALLAAMTKKNIIIYIPKDEFAIFGQFLLSHIYYTYGIVMNTPTSAYSFNQIKFPFIISKFYMMDLIEPQDYIDMYPSTLQLPSWVINKLAIEMKPFNYPATFQQYIDYFNGLVAMKNTEKQVMVKVVDKNGGILK